MDLKNKTALITGGGQGIGEAIALRLAGLGASIVLVDNNDAQAIRVAGLLEGMGIRVKAFQADVSDFNRAQFVVEESIQHFGQIDILVNNAGINRDAVIWKMTEGQWDQVIDVNLKGYFNYIKAVVPSFKDQQSGKIINLTSINGMRGKFGQANYAAAKAGIIGLTKTLAKELGKFSINVNAVAPGLIETDMMKNASPTVREAALQEIVLGRLGQPQDIANLVAFLASDWSQHITGEVIKVDGGQYI